jgi:GNAT superfamily N-acetyltransferase
VSRPHETTLRDGRRVVIRRLTPADAPELEKAFALLSAESRRLRFLGSKARLSPSELRYLTDVDGHRHEALCAIDPHTGRGVGVARFVKDPADPSRAEVAVTVVDDWQRRGLGTLLLAELTERARQEHVSHFTALVSADNRSVRRLLDRLDAPVEPIRLLGAAAEYEIELGPRGLGARLHDALRAAAEGYWHLPPRLREALSSLVPIHPRHA